MPSALPFDLPLRAPDLWAAATRSPFLDGVLDPRRRGQLGDRGGAPVAKDDLSPDETERRGGTT
ncbi:MAG: hypothetical protein M3Y49_14290 [Actinomycetota bacterium]|nr:hypothetical protein [Actinomycetota bacterium]